MTTIRAGNRGSGHVNHGSNGKYIVTMDFSKYPELHERLLKLAEQEFRTPELQLMYMLGTEFHEMEGEK